MSMYSAPIKIHTRIYIHKGKSIEILLIEKKTEVTNDLSIGNWLNYGLSVQ